MNERIDKLAEQAGCSIDGMGYGEGNIEGFAELLIRECAEWLKQPVNQTPLSGAVMNIAADRLKEHFGVEE